MKSQEAVFVSKGEAGLPTTGTHSLGAATEVLETDVDSRLRQAARILANGAIRAASNRQKGLLTATPLPSQEDATKSAPEVAQASVLAPIDIPKTLRKGRKSKRSPVEKGLAASPPIGELAIAGGLSGNGVTAVDGE